METTASNSLFLSAPGSGVVATKVTVLMGYSVVETTGSSFAWFRLRDGSLSGQPLVAKVTINPGDSERHFFGWNGVVVPSGNLYLETNGAIEVTLWFVEVQPGTPEVFPPPGPDITPNPISSPFQSIFTSTPIFNQSALGYPVYGTYGAFEVPMHITSYKGPYRQPSVIPWTSIPNMDQGSNLSYGGVALGMGAAGLPQIDLQGFIDTPFADDGNGNMLPTITRDGMAVMYHDLISACMEGRYTNGYTKLDPSYWRDPLGRVFKNPTITTFSGTYLEGRPGRINFTMTLMV